jgi:protein associated with RNAse G/E
MPLSEAFTRSGVFEHSSVKLVPAGTFWTACFQAVDPVVDVDIVLPVLWTGDALEETDCELDILRSADGTVYVRDQEEFDHVRLSMGIPDDISAQAEATCQRLRELVERRVEPFGEVGQEWLSRFSRTGG